MPNIMKIKYADATVRQLAKAKSQHPSKINNFGYGQNYGEILQSLKKIDEKESYKSYDKYGRVTIVGKAKRIQDLRDLKLNDDTTLGEFLTKQAEKTVARLKKLWADFNNNMDANRK